MIVEVCANSLQSALNAQEAGADRIELCSELGVGGVTPSHGLLKKVRELISIPVRVLIRPRSGDFTYTDEEFGIMVEDIVNCRDMGFEGVVSGVLKSDFSLDVERTKVLLDVVGNLKFTFHRAFDWVKDPMATLMQLEDMGVSDILTSGQQKTAVEGLQLLQEILSKASSCTVMPGGGVKPGNAHWFKEHGFTALHLSGTRFFQTLVEQPTVSMNSPSFLNDHKIALTDVRVIQDVIKVVK